MKLSSLMAGIFGTVGFVISVLAGIHADNPFEGILLRALLACGICYAVGYLVGMVGHVITAEHSVAIAKRVAELDAQEAAEKEAKARKEAAEAAESAQVAAAAPGQVVSP